MTRLERVHFVLKEGADLSLLLLMFLLLVEPSSHELLLRFLRFSNKRISSSSNRASSKVVSFLHIQEQSVSRESSCRCILLLRHAIHGRTSPDPSPLKTQNETQDTNITRDEEGVKVMKMRDE